MDERERLLVDAAFHAWVTLGELLAEATLTPEERDEVQGQYTALTAALKGYDPPG